MAKQSSSSSYRKTGSSPTRGSGTVRRTTSSRRQGAQVNSNVTFGFPWTRQNVIGITGGVVLIIASYWLMGTAITPDVAHNAGIWNNTNAITIAPILLTIGYCVIIPYFIFRRFKKPEVAEENN